VVSFAPQPIHPLGKNLRYPLERRLDGPQNWSGRPEEDNLIIQIKVEFVEKDDMLYLLSSALFHAEAVAT
jgi:hypothetical protein